MSNTKKPRTASEKLAAAERTQDSMTVNLPGPRRAKWKTIKEAYDRKNASKSATEMLVPDPELKRLAAQLAELEEQMAENAIVVTVQAMRRERTPSTPKDELTWKELCEAHPPRKGKDGKPLPEDSTGVNMQTFPEQLIRASIIGPDDLSPEEWDALLYEYMTDAQYDGLFEMCWRLNRNKVDVPFSFAASKTLKSGSSSRRPNGSASRAAASKAGNPSK
ncbi:hypothetical protein [Glycomyces sp. NPDC021274]|uniref:hypothetical protein n=1 Tax=Glycomyces sp. NPDC021274 TaxID=3155120 RepID=UPI0033C257DB